MVTEGLCLLHQVLNARQRLYWHRGVRGASLLGKLQDGHVAQRAHLPHLQPLNEAPGRKERRSGSRVKERGTDGGGWRGIEK